MTADALIEAGDFGVRLARHSSILASGCAAHGVYPRLRPEVGPVGAGVLSTMNDVSTLAQPRRPLAAIVIAALAHLLVGFSWMVTTAAAMGLLDVGRRALMNSQWSWVPPRLVPPAWVIVPGLVAIVLSHLLFRWSMRGAHGGEALYGPSVVALMGALLGVLWGAYAFTPPVTVGVQVGPAHGQVTRWGLPAWVAYYARLWLPALMALLTAALVLVGRNSPWVALLHALRRRRGRKLRAQDAVALEAARAQSAA